MPKTVAFFETGEQLELILSWQRDTKRDLHFVALTAEGDYAAETRSLEYNTIEDFYSDPELMERGVREFKRVVDFCAKVDTYLAPVLADSPEGRWVSAHLELYFLKRFLDTLLARTVAVKSTLQTLSAQSVVCCTPVEMAPLACMGHQQASWGLRVIPRVATVLGCDVTTLDVPQPLSEQQLMRRHWWVKTLATLPGGALLVEVLRGLRHRLSGTRPVSASMSWNGIDSSKPVLIYADNPERDVMLIIAEWERRWPGQSRPAHAVREKGLKNDLYAVGSTMQEVIQGCRATWRAVQSDAEFRALFVIDDVDLWPVVREAVQAFVIERIPNYAREVILFARGLQDIGPAVFLSVVSLGVWELYANVARGLGIPAVSLQHGGTFGYTELPIVEHTDLYSPAYFLVYGTGTVAGLEERDLHAHCLPGSPRAQPVAVGSPALDSVKQQYRRVASVQSISKAGANRRAMYVTNTLLGDLRYFSYHLYPDIAYWRLQRQVVELCSRFPGIELILKLYPRDWLSSPLEQWVKKQGFRNCRIIRETPFSGVLPQTDLFILDYPTTTLLEALVTEKPVIVLADRSYYRLRPFAVQSLRKRAILSETPEQFLHDIAEVLKQDDWSFHQEINDKFLCAYGTHLNDGRSAERAVQLLTEVAFAGAHDT